LNYHHRGNRRRTFPQSFSAPSIDLASAGVSGYGAAPAALTGERPRGRPKIEEKAPAMAQNRKPVEPPMPRNAVDTILAGETLRKIAEPPAPCPPAKGEEKISLFWRVFGGTLLSIVALVGMTVYQQFSATITDLRQAILHLNETHADMVKKDDFEKEINDMRSGVVHLNEVHADMARKDDVNTKAKGLWDLIKEVGGDAAALKTRAALLEAQLKNAEDERKEMQHEVQMLRERLISLEGRVGATPTKPASKNSDP
jgi:hypothetical protein